MRMMQPPESFQPKILPTHSSQDNDPQAAAEYLASQAHYSELPPTTLPRLRNSERHDFKRCPLRWWWRYQEHLVPVTFSTGPLLFGSLGHLALAEYYIPGTKRGADPRETWERITRELWDAVKIESFVDDEIEGTWEDARTLGYNMLDAYLKHYGNDDHWEVLWVEDRFQQNIPHPDDLRKKRQPARAIVASVGTIDLIVRNHETGLIEYVDHKFMKVIETGHLYIDDQNGGYLSIGTRELRKRGLLGPKESVRVLVYNFLRKGKPDNRPRNAEGKATNLPQVKHYQEQIAARLKVLGKYAEGETEDMLKKMKKAELEETASKLKLVVLGDVSERQPTALFHRERIERTALERNKQIERIAQEAYVMEQFRQRKLPIFKTPTRDCVWDCSFFDLCQIHESGGDVEHAKELMFRKDDPYREYVPGAASPKKLS